MKLAGAVAVPDPVAAREVLEKYYRATQTAPGVVRFEPRDDAPDGTSPRPCVLAVSSAPDAGVSRPTRLVCGGTADAVRHLGPYLTRTMTRLASRDDVRLEVFVRELRPPKSGRKELTAGGWQPVDGGAPDPVRQDGRRAGGEAPRRRRVPGPRGELRRDRRRREALDDLRRRRLAAHARARRRRCARRAAAGGVRATSPRRRVRVLRARRDPCGPGAPPPQVVRLPARMARRRRVHPRRDRHAARAVSARPHGGTLGGRGRRSPRHGAHGARRLRGRRQDWRGGAREGPGRDAGLVGRRGRGAAAGLD